MVCNESEWPINIICKRTWKHLLPNVWMLLLDAVTCEPSPPTVFVTGAVSWSVRKLGNRFLLDSCLCTDTRSSNSSVNEFINPIQHIDPRGCLLIEESKWLTFWIAWRWSLCIIFVTSEQVDVYRNPTTWNRSLGWSKSSGDKLTKLSLCWRIASDISVHHGGIETSHESEGIREASVEMLTTAVLGKTSCGMWHSLLTCHQRSEIW
jgi:hypothetical protein